MISLKMGNNGMYYRLIKKRKSREIETIDSGEKYWKLRKSTVFKKKSMES